MHILLITTYWFYRSSTLPSCIACPLESALFPTHKPLRLLYECTNCCLITDVNERLEQCVVKMQLHVVRRGKDWLDALTLQNVFYYFPPAFQHPCLPLGVVGRIVSPSRVVQLLSQKFSSENLSIPVQLSALVSSLCIPLT